MPKRPPLPHRKRVPAIRAIERWLGVIALSAAFVLAIAATLVLHVANQSMVAAKQVAHSYQIATELDALRTALQAAEAGERGFILVGRPSALEPYQLALFQANLHVAALRPMAYDQEDQYADVLRLGSLVQAHFHQLSKLIDLREQSGLDAARRALDADSDQNTMERIEALVSSLQQREQERLETDRNREQAASDQALVVMVTTLMALSVLALFFWLVLKREFALRGRLEAALVESATSDELTGAINRSEFERLLGQEWAFRIRYGTPLSLLLIDLENFEEISSTWGLRAGDAILRDVVRRLRGRLRTTERLARYGGQQFALLVPQPLAAAMQLARSLAELVTGEPYPVRDFGDKTHESVELRVCIGVADASDVDQETELVQAAGDALFTAKSGVSSHIEAYRAALQRDDLGLGPVTA